MHKLSQRKRSLCMHLFMANVVYFSIGKYAFLQKYGHFYKHYFNKCIKLIHGIELS